MTNIRHKLDGMIWFTSMKEANEAGYFTNEYWEQKGRKVKEKAIEALVYITEGNVSHQWNVYLYAQTEPIN